MSKATLFVGGTTMCIMGAITEMESYFSVGVGLIMMGIASKT